MEYPSDSESIPSIYRLKQVQVKRAADSIHLFREGRNTRERTNSVLYCTIIFHLTW